MNTSDNKKAPFGAFLILIIFASNVNTIESPS